MIEGSLQGNLLPTKVASSSTKGSTMFRFIFFLQFLILLPISFSYELREQDALCGPGDSCYAVFYQRRAFLESWRACREKGGNLATIKNGQEAALIEQLLSSSVGSRGNREPQFRLWIGLQRQPRQCASQKPLRGFTWTTGDQDTAYTNWVNQPVSGGPPSSCSASRCVAIGLGYGDPEDDFKWLDGSCTLPVDGFVCKFRYQGLCPVLNEEKVHYSVPFGYEGTWLDLLPFGTVAVVSCEGQHQSISVLCMLKEDGSVGWNNDEPLCQQPEDLQCQGCQQLCEDGVCTCHQGYVLQPDGLSCEPEDDHSYEAQGCPCQYQCLTGATGKGYQCICPKGYELAADEHSCEDVDECEDEDTCEHSCQNTLGSYTCSCDLGYTVSEEDPERCVDVDECRIARICQQMCVNYDGGFECYCNEGYELDTDRMSCNPADFREPRYEPNPAVKINDNPQLELFDPTTEGWYWTEMDDPETTRTHTEQPMPPMYFEEDTIVDTTVKEIAETSTFLQDLEKPLKIATSPTSAPTQTTTPVFKMDKIRRTTYHTPTTATSKSFATSSSAEMPEGTSSGNTWVKENAGDASTIIQPGTSTAPSKKATVSTVDDSKTLFNDSHLPTEMPAIILKDKTTVASPDILLSNDRNADSADLSSVSPNVSQESWGKRDNRWLVVALLVPLCVFLVIMLALGIVYCTRCGGETKPRSVTDCYHWVTGGGPEKSLPPSGVEPSSSRGAV